MELDLYPYAEAIYYFPEKNLPAENIRENVVYWNFTNHKYALCDILFDMMNNFEVDKK